MFFKDRLLGPRKIAVLLHEVAAGKLPLIMTSCITLYNFLSETAILPFHAFHSVFLRSGLHSCPLWYTFDSQLDQVANCALPSETDLLKGNTQSTVIDKLGEYARVYARHLPYSP